MAGHPGKELKTKWKVCETSDCPMHNNIHTQTEVHPQSIE